MKKLFYIILFVTAVTAETFNLSTRTPTSGTNWHFDANLVYEDVYTQIAPGVYGPVSRTVPTLFVNNGANLTITGTSDPVTNTTSGTYLRIQVSGTARITLNNATNISVGDAMRFNVPKDGMPAHYVNVSPMQLVDGAHLALTLVGNNRLEMARIQATNALVTQGYVSQFSMGARWSAGLGVPQGTSIVIQGDGQLTARGGTSASGIGGHQGGVPGTHFGRPAGNITINSGTIIASGVELAAGIGSGSNLQGGTITINGGNITATGGSGTNIGGPGIGGGGNSTGVGYPEWCDHTIININGGVVVANGGNAAAGIGTGSGGLNNNAVNITVNINAGEVRATGGGHVLGRGGAGIGGGDEVSGGNINIRGGTVTATTLSDGTTASAGIGGGSFGNAGNINIRGGTIFVRGGGGNAQHIGGGTSSGNLVAGGTVRIDPSVEVSNTIPE
jgi:hypothetical protein